MMQPCLLVIHPRARLFGLLQTCPTTHCCTWDADLPGPAIVADIDPTTGVVR